MLLPKDIYNQGLKRVMRMSCTRCSMKHIVDAQNSEVQMRTGKPYEFVDVESIWNEWLEAHPECENNGDYIQNGPEQFKAKGLITGTSQVFTVDEAKHSIFNRRLIATGSRDGNWQAVRDNKVYEQRTDGKIVGHAFCIVGWDSDGFIAINSYGESNGPFTIPYGLWDTLYSKTAIHDTTDDKAINDYNNRIMANITIEDAKKALEQGIWNGERPQETASREEVAAMIARALAK